jgi:hypothetical protein
MNIELQTNTEDPTLEFLNIEKYDDRSGFGATINVASNGFSAKVFCTFGEWPMDEFISQLESCNNSLSGQATLKPEWDNWFITFTVKNNGQVEVNGMLYSADQELKYEFITDQTCLSPLIKDLKEWQR